MKTRELTKNERKAVDSLYSEYLDTQRELGRRSITATFTETMRLFDEIDDAWKLYMQKVESMGIIPTLSGYRSTNVH